MRQQLGSLMVEAIDWAEEHRSQLVVGSFLAAASGVALLIHIHGVPGFTRITSNAELATRVLQKHQNSTQGQLRLPVLLSSATIQDGHLVVDAVHYPALLRWYDWFKGRKPPLPAYTPQAAATTANGTISISAVAQAGRVGAVLKGEPAANHIRCHIAGVSDVQPQAQQLLQQYIAVSPTKVQQLQVFAVTHGTAANHMSKAATNDAQQGSANTSLPWDTDQSPQQQQQHQRGDITIPEAESHTAMEPVMQQQYSSNPQQFSSAQQQLRTAAGADSSTMADQIWAELWIQGLSRSAYRSAAAAAAASTTAAAKGPQGASAAAAAAAAVWRPDSSSMSSSWWFSRKRDAAEQLLHHGLARVVPQEDFEWLGVRLAAAKAYNRAADHAMQKCVGIFVVQVPPSKAWSVASYLRKLTKWRGS